MAWVMIWTICLVIMGLMIERDLLAEAHCYLAELKGWSESLPNSAIRSPSPEVKDSSEIVDIFTMRVSLSEAWLVLINQADHRCVVASKQENSALPKIRNTPARLLQQRHTASVQFVWAICLPARAVWQQAGFR